MEKSFAYLNSTIHYSVTGQGKPVVLIHGFGEDRSIWNKQVAFLKTYCKLLVPDLPGTGKSGLLSGNEISIEDYADCIHQLLQHEEIREVTMLGHSMGGYITLAFAEKYPTWLSGFGLINSTAFADTEEKKIVRKKGIEMIKEYGSYSFLKNVIPNLFSNNFKKNNGEIIKPLIEAGNSFSPDALIQYYSAMMNRPDRTHVLKDSSVPVLFVIGKQDVAAPIDDLNKQIDLPELPYIHILDEVGHMSMLEATDQLNANMLEFINR